MNQLCVPSGLYSTYAAVLLGKEFTSIREECSSFVCCMLFLVRFLLFVTCKNFALSLIQQHGIFKNVAKSVFLVTGVSFSGFPKKLKYGMTELSFYVQK